MKLVAQSNEAQNSVFARLIEITSTYPPLVKRVAEIRQFVLGIPQVTVERSAATTLGAVMLLPFAGLQGMASGASAVVVPLALVAVLAAILFPGSQQLLVMGDHLFKRPGDLLHQSLCRFNNRADV